MRLKSSSRCYVVAGPADGAGAVAYGAPYGQAGHGQPKDQAVMMAVTDDNGTNGDNDDDDDDDDDDDAEMSSQRFSSCGCRTS
jgi:hypothetical protein